MVDTENIHKISQLGKSNTLTTITDGADFPHTGLIKALNQMSSGNIVVKTGADFDINQTGGNIIVDAGKILRNGMYHSVNTKTFADTDLITTHDKGYHLLVVADGRESGETVNNLYLRTPTAPNVVADFKLGDTIVAMIEYASTTSAGSRLIQFFTTSKEENGVSIAYADSNVYTEVGSIYGTSDGLFIDGIGTVAPAADGSDKVIIQNASDVIKSVTVAQINALAPQGDITGITAGTGLTGGGTSGAVTLNVEGLTVSELAATSVLVAGEAFADNDTNLMTAAAINDRIQSFSYTTNVGDITSVVAGTGLSGGATSGDATVNLDLTDGITVSDGLTITDATTLTLDIEEIIANDVDNRVLTSDGDGTLTAESFLTVDGSVISINGSLARSVIGGAAPLNTDSMHNIIRELSNVLDLPSANGLSTRVFRIKNYHDNNLLINATGGEKFEFDLTSSDSRWVSTTQLVLRPRQTVLLQAVADNFIVAEETGPEPPSWLILDNDTNLINGGEINTGKTFRTPRLATVQVGAGTGLTEATHAGAYLICAGNVTLPTTSSEGEHYTILNTTGGNITVTATNNTTINGGSANTAITVASYNAVTCIGIGSNNWIALGV